jgi:lysophospholipase L1-like esterase
MFTLSPYDLDSPFAAELQVFAQAQAEGAVPRGAVLFCGSSSIRLWTTLAEDFPTHTVLNRGFGGSTLAELLNEVDWMICAAQPRAIVLYAGDNDLDHGARPEQVLALFERFMARVRVPVLFVSIKPSLARFGNVAAISHTNALIRAAIVGHPQARFVDVFSQMLEGGQPRRTLFDADGLHLSAAGYALWTRALHAAFAELP